MAFFVVAIALTASVVSPASATPDPGAASSSSRWLSSQLVDGVYQNPLSPGPDYGLMIDAVFAMYASGDGALAEPILQVLDDDEQAIDYFSYAGFLGDAGLDDRQGGQTAKTLLAAIVGKRDPHAFGGYDMVAETLGVITPDGPEAGRVRDHGPNIGINNANTFGQILAVIALAAVGELHQPVVDQLLRQQCSEGYFRIFYYFDPVPPNAPNDCDGGKPYDQSTPDGDTTGFGLSALLTARAFGVTGLDDAIDRARTWLVDEQDASGGWGGGVGTTTPNTNSTGLIVQGLADAGGADVASDGGRDFIRSAQVTDADAGNALAGDLGAIAYKPADYVAARPDGIGSLDTWIRASAQASLGLSQVSFYDLVTQQVPPSSTSTTSSSTTTSTGVVDAFDASDGVDTARGTLPATGRDSAWLATTGATLLFVGVLLVVTSRRRAKCG